MSIYFTHNARFVFYITLSS